MTPVGQGFWMLNLGLLTQEIDYEVYVLKERGKKLLFANKLRPAEKKIEGKGGEDIERLKAFYALERDLEDILDKQWDGMTVSERRDCLSHLNINELLEKLESTSLDNSYLWERLGQSIPSICSEKIKHYLVAKIEEIESLKERESIAQNLSETNPEILCRCISYFRFSEEKREALAKQFVLTKPGYFIPCIGLFQLQEEVRIELAEMICGSQAVFAQQILVENFNLFNLPENIRNSIALQLLTKDMRYLPLLKNWKLSNETRLAIFTEAEKRQGNVFITAHSRF